MNRQPQPPLAPAKPDLPLAHGSTDIKQQKAALRPHHRERLTRLFRHVGDTPDERYLLDIMTRYRRIEAP